LAGLTDYQHVHPYLNSRSLRWSYGAMKGRATDRWQEAAAARPVPRMVETLRGAGFGGLYVNRDGFPDGGRQIEAALHRLVPTPPPLVSEDGRLWFLPLPR
jgi:phosphoglycerol transferase